MRIAIDAIKRLKQRDVAVQISMGCIKKGQKQDIEEVRQASIPKNGVCLAKLLPRGQMQPTAIVLSGAAGCGCGGGAGRGGGALHCQRHHLPRGQEQAAAPPREVEVVAQMQGGEGGGAAAAAAAGRAQAATWRRGVVGLKRAGRYGVLVWKWGELGGLPPRGTFSSLIHKNNRSPV